MKQNIFEEHFFHYSCFRYFLSDFIHPVFRHRFDRRGHGWSWQPA
jgi:hypothetical protein